jgi:uncharacterized protein
VETAVTLTAGAGTDFFVHPSTGEAAESAAVRLQPVEGDFVLSALVEAELASTFDAGALLVRGGTRTWGKLALELSPEGEPTIVSVVTRGRSDDCNSVVVAGRRAWLRVARMGDAFAFHSSADGRRWSLVRHFHLPGVTEAGFAAQSPTGPGCAATFSDVRLERRTLAELRDGS